MGKEPSECYATSVAPCAFMGTAQGLLLGVGLLEVVPKCHYWSVGFVVPLIHQQTLPLFQPDLQPPGCVCLRARVAGTFSTLVSS